MGSSLPSVYRGEPVLLIWEQNWCYKSCDTKSDIISVLAYSTRQCQCSLNIYIYKILKVSLAPVFRFQFFLLELFLFFQTLESILLRKHFLSLTFTTVLLLALAVDS